MNVTTWAPYSSRTDPVLSDFCFYHVLHWCYFLSCCTCPLPVSFIYKSICEINPKGMTEVYLWCCFFLHQKKIILRRQLPEKNSPNPDFWLLESDVPYLPSWSAPLGSLLLANVLFSHKHSADATGRNAAGTCHPSENFHLLYLGLNPSVNKR